ncbi:endonuclease domain-containing protein [Algoriphagus sp. AGSA1]|nr:endonuclease domain-containing protein [Algoriphagus sp. AGSA1]
MLTPAERKLWEVLQNKQLDGYKFRRQHPIRHGAQVLQIHCRFLLP